MDSNRFDSLTRSLTVAGSRRGALVATLAGAIGLLGWHGVDDSAAHDPSNGCKKKSGKAKKKCLKKAKKHNAQHASETPSGCPAGCGACQVCSGSACVRATDDSSCNEDGRCLAGVCNPKPTCAEKATPCSPTNHLACCSGYCFQPNYPDTAGSKCFPSQTGNQCYNDASCNSDNTGTVTCVGYRCR